MRQRESDNRILATDEDVREISAIYDEIREANELGIAPQVFEIFNTVIARFSDGASKKQILTEYHRIYHRPLGPKRLETQILPALEGSGLVSEEADPNDRRRVLYYPHPPGNTSSGGPSSNNIPPEVGVNEELENPSLLHPEIARMGHDLTGTDVTLHYNMAPDGQVDHFDTSLITDYILRSAIPAEQQTTGYATSVKIRYLVSNRFDSHSVELIPGLLDALVKNGKVSPGPFRDTWVLA